MLRKALRTLTGNPVLTLVYLIYMLVAIVPALVLMPVSTAETDPLVLLQRSVISLFLSLLVMVLGLFFVAGYGHMTAEAVTTGKTGFMSFFSGIRQFFVNTLLSGLLLCAMVLGLCIILGILTVPLIMIFVFSDPTSAAVPGSPFYIAMVSGYTAAIIFFVPFVALWLPALFIDRLGVIDSFVKGLKTGARNYGIILLWCFIAYLPAFANILISLPNAQRGVILTPAYFVIMLVSAVFFIIFITAIFTLYNERCKKTVPLQYEN